MLSRRHVTLILISLCIISTFTYFTYILLRTLYFHYSTWNNSINLTFSVLSLNLSFTYSLRKTEECKDFWVKLQNKTTSVSSCSVGPLPGRPVPGHSRAWARHGAWGVAGRPRWRSNSGVLEGRLCAAKEPRAQSGEEERAGLQTHHPTQHVRFGHQQSAGKLCRFITCYHIKFVVLHLINHIMWIQYWLLQPVVWMRTSISVWHFLFISPLFVPAHNFSPQSSLLCFGLFFLDARCPWPVFPLFLYPYFPPSLSLSVFLSPSVPLVSFSPLFSCPASVAGEVVGGDSESEGHSFVSGEENLWLGE